MKVVRLSVRVFLAATLVATTLSAQEQIPFLADDIIPLSDDPSSNPALVGDKNVPPPPPPEPIWTLCGDPSKHILVP